MITVTVISARFYNPGSHISLNCVIRRRLIRNATVQDITNVTWKKDGEVLDLLSQERISMGVQVEGDRLVSTLLINRAEVEDEGVYSCSLPVFSNREFPRAKATVHVITGDRLAVQGGGRRGAGGLDRWGKILYCSVG